MGACSWVDQFTKIAARGQFLDKFLALFCGYILDTLTALACKAREGNCLDEIAATKAKAVVGV